MTAADADSVAAHIWTLGYQDRTFSDVVALLKQRRIESVVDLREQPRSANYWFSKSTLSVFLALYGIDYLRFPALTTPRRGCLQDLAEDEATALRTTYRHRLTSADAAEELAALRRLCRQERTVLLCYEADEDRCLRGELAAVIRATLV